MKHRASEARITCVQGTTDKRMVPLEETLRVPSVLISAAITSFFFLFLIWGALGKIYFEKCGLLTYCGPRFGPVQGTDDNKAKAFILLAVDHNVTGLQAVSSEALGGCSIATRDSMITVSISSVVTSWRTVVCRH